MSSRYAIILSVTAVLLFSAPSAPLDAQAETGADHGRGVMAGSRATFAIDDPKVRLVLGEVRQRSQRQPGPSVVPQLIVYDATVLSEFRNSIREGTEIQIQGTSEPQSAGVEQIPKNMPPGAVFVIAVQTTDNVNVFNYAGPASLIGEWTPCEVDKREAAEIKIAMARLGDIAGAKGLGLPKDEALKLLSTKDNYHLWALGAMALAAGGDQASADTMFKMYRDQEDLNPRQIVWLDHCVSDVLPGTVAIGMNFRHQLILDYLRRLGRSSPTSMPSLPERR